MCSFICSCERDVTDVYETNRISTADMKSSEE